METPLKLQIDFSDRPTKSQIDNALGDIATFLTQMGAALLYQKDYTPADESIGRLLSVAVQVKQTKDSFAGTLVVGMPQVQAQPQPMPPGGRRG